MAITPHYGLTLLAQSQAQKEVTVNEALVRIDSVLKQQSAGGSNTSWRRNPLAVTDSGGEASTIAAVLTAGGNAPFFYVNTATTRTLTFDLPAFSREGMAAWEMEADSATIWTITYEESFDGGVSYSSPVGVSTIQVSPQRTVRLQKHEFAAGPARRVRLSFAHNGTASPAYWRGGRYIRNLAFFEFEPENRHDYIVWIGDSISELSIRHHEAQSLLKQYYGHDVCIFNEAVAGWTTADVISNLSAILARHPKAQHVVLMIGTNDISSLRPYNTMTQAEIDTLRGSLLTIINAVQTAGKTIQLARIPYSNFVGVPAVNGITNEENGAKPFNEGIMDRLIAAYSPQMFDGGKGVLDSYGYLRDNYHLFNADPNGVHAYHYGARLFGKYMLLRFGSALWAKRFAEVANDDVVNGVLGAKEHVRISFGSVFGSSLGNDSQSVLNATYSGLFDSKENITWNNIAGNVAASFPALINTEGERTKIGLTIVTPFSAITGNNITSVLTNGLNTPYIESAKLSYAANTSGATSNMKVTGLNPSARYTLKFFGSRDGSGTETSTYAETVNGVSTSVNVADNLTNVVSLTNLAPNVSGELIVTVNRPGSLSVLNLIEIIKE
jgi:lysophospholipase L1-like esterase